MLKDLQSYLKDKNAGYTHTQLPWTQCHGFSTAHDERFVSLSPGTVITLGGVHKFRFNHPAEAAVLRERRRVGANRPKTNAMLLIRMTIMKIFMMSRWLGDTLDTQNFPFNTFLILSVNTKILIFLLRPVKVAWPAPTQSFALWPLITGKYCFKAMFPTLWIYVG